MDITAIRGKDGFLFLGGDSNPVLDQITARRNLSTAMLQRWNTSINARVDFCKKNGCEYFVFIAPNKHCVYREFLPEGLFVSDKRVAKQLEQVSSNVFYPCSTLRKYTDCLTYYKLDTHWNEVGCCVAWNEFFQSKLGLDGLKIPGVKEFKTGPGDLGATIDPKMSSYAYSVELEHTSKSTWDNLLFERGLVRVFKNTIPKQKRAIIFGDSFSNGFLNRIADYFSETYFFHTPFFYKDIITRLSPDVVINANVERFFYSPLPLVGTIASDLLQYFWNGQYDCFTLKRFMSVPWNEVFPRDVYDEMRSSSANFIDTYTHFKFNTVEGLLRAAPGQSQLERLDELIAYNQLPFFYYQKSILQTKNGDFQGASESIERALDSCPRSDVYLFRSSNIFSDLGMYDQAIKRAQDAIAVKDNYAHFYSHLGNLLWKTGDLDGAKDALEKAIALDSLIPDPHFQLSQIYNQRGDIEQAIKKAQDAIAVKDDNPHFYSHLGNLLRNIGDLDGAKEAQEKAIALAPLVPGPHFQLSQIYNQCGDTEQAIKKARDAIAVKNDNPPFYLHLGNLLRNIGDLDGVKDALEKAIALDSLIPDPHFQLSQIYSQRGDTEQAIKKAQDAIAVKDDNPHFYSHLGNLLRNIGDLDGAKEAQEKAIALAPLVPGPHFQLSQIYNQHGDIEQAIKKAQDAIAVKNDDPHFYSHLGSLLWNIGDLDGAKEAQAKAIALAK